MLDKKGDEEMSQTGTLPTYAVMHIPALSPAGGPFYQKISFFLQAGIQLCFVLTRLQFELNKLH